MYSYAAILLNRFLYIARHQMSRMMLFSFCQRLSLFTRCLVLCWRRSCHSLCRQKNFVQSVKWSLERQCKEEGTDVRHDDCFECVSQLKFQYNCLFEGVDVYHLHKRCEMERLWSTEVVDLQQNRMDQIGAECALRQGNEEAPTQEAINWS